MAKYSKAMQEWRYKVGFDTRPDDLQQPYKAPPPSVYFIQDGDAIKIGFGVHPTERLKMLQTGNPRELSIIGSFYANRSEEYALHNLFVAYHIRGEWFRDHPELRELIATRCHANDNAVVPAAEVA